MKKVISIILSCCLMVVLLPYTKALENEETSSDKHHYLQQLVEALIAEDAEAALNLLIDSQVELQEGFSEYRNYKILITSDSKQDSAYYERVIQVRPNTGKGFYCGGHSYLSENGTVTFTFWGEGQCKDWNWNGAYTITETGNYKPYISTTTHTGVMKNGYLDGTVHMAQTFREGNADLTTLPVESSEFQNGVLQRKDQVKLSQSAVL